MDFLAAARHLAEDLSSDMSMDVSQMDPSETQQNRRWGQPPTQTDHQDPATPGGPSPYNGAPPFSQPVTSDPEWLDPQDRRDKPDYLPMPHTPGPDEDVTTLRAAQRRQIYTSTAERYRAHE